MDCGSNYVWLDDALDAEIEAEVSAPLFEQQVQIQTKPIAQHEDIPAPPVQPSGEKKLKTEVNFKKKVRLRNAGTNVISINFQTLIDSAKISTGDPVFCTHCKAVLSCSSVIKYKGQNNNAPNPNADPGKVEVPEGAGVWNCEFCGKDNEVDLIPEEVPTADVVDYLLSSNGEKSKEDKSKFTVFCVDISGSMGTSYEVKGKLKMKGQEKIDRLQSLNTEKNQFGHFAEQYLPKERRDVTYVTRLQCIQAAISTQIENMSKTDPEQRIAICTFNRDVQLYSSKNKQKTIAGDKLDKYDLLFEEGKSFDVKETLKDNKADLDQHLFSLEENGATALGPALTVSLGLVSETPGSKIILCTDGLSNVGVGSLDELKTSEQKEQASKFYETIGLYAKSKGVTISVLSIAGQDCSLENLGQLTEITSGEIDRVDPLKISKNFATIMNIPVLATQVVAILRLHKGLEVNDADSEQVEKKDVLNEFGAFREIGNATVETVATFQYGLKPHVKKDDFKQVKELPFQLQLQYTKLDGKRYMRVISKRQPITFDRDVAEKEANVAVLGVHGIQQSAKLASKGDYTRGRFANWMHHDMMSRAATTEEKKKQFHAFSKMGQKFESEMSKVQQKELFSEGVDLDDDVEEEKDEDEEEQEVVETRSYDDRKKVEKVDKKMAKMKARKEKRGDKTANMLYQMKAMNSKKMMYEAEDDDAEEETE